MPSRQWPSIQSQVTQSGAPRGSSLDRVIRENQEFELLESEELSDGYDLPPWLRVLWRKSHPDFRPAAGKPGEAYPDILYTIYARMVANPDLEWSGPEGASPAAEAEKAPPKRRRRKNGA